jgi:signal recognition particle GTPase
MNRFGCASTEQFWKRIDNLNARELVISSISAAREQVEYARALAISKRAEILVGKNAGQEYQMTAEMHFRKRTSQLRNTKQQMAQFIESLDETLKQQLEEFINRNGINEYMAYAKQAVTLRLLNTDISPEDATKAVKQLDSTVQTIRGLTSLKKIEGYLQRHLDELIKKKMGNPSANPLCVFLLLITSILVILIIIAALICALTFGLACEGLLDQLIDDACN